MHAAPLAIFIIGDDATTNLMSGFILRRYFGNPDIHFFSDPDVALESIRRYGLNAPPTLIFLDTDTRGMTWIAFLNFFSALPESVQNRYQLFLPAFPNSSESGSARHPKVKIVPWPLNLTVMQELGAEHRFRLPLANTAIPSTYLTFQNQPATQ